MSIQLHPETNPTVDLVKTVNLKTVFQNLNLQIPPNRNLNLIQCQYLQYVMMTHPDPVSAPRIDWNLNQNIKLKFSVGSILFVRCELITKNKVGHTKTKN